jgi:hypothetical protein
LSQENIIRSTQKGDSEKSWDTEEESTVGETPLKGNSSHAKVESPIKEPSLVKEPSP